MVNCTTSHNTYMESKRPPPSIIFNSSSSSSISTPLYDVGKSVVFSSNCSACNAQDFFISLYEPHIVYTITYIVCAVYENGERAERRYRPSKYAYTRHVRTYQSHRARCRFQKILQRANSVVFPLYILIYTIF